MLTLSSLRRNSTYGKRASSCSLHHRNTAACPERNLINDLTKRSAVTGPGNPETQKPRTSGAFLQADDGTRTHDLLHGKRTWTFLKSLYVPLCGFLPAGE